MLSENRMLQDAKRENNKSHKGHDEMYKNG